MSRLEVSLLRAQEAGRASEQILCRRLLPVACDWKLAISILRGHQREILPHNELMLRFLDLLLDHSLLFLLLIDILSVIIGLVRVVADRIRPSQFLRCS